MKLVVLRVSLAVVAFASLASLNAAQAIDGRHNTQHNAQLGAPLYVGPNVVVIQDGYGRSSSGYGLTGSVTVHGRPPPRRYGYNPGHRYGKWNGGHQYGHRPPPPRYNYGRPPPRYYAPPRRERHPPPHVHGNPNRGPNYGYDPYRNPGYDNPRHANPDNQHRGPRLTILGATYRSIDGRSCNAYSYAHRKCDGNQSCTVSASNSICGDPDRGRLKVLEVSYACGNRQFTSYTPERSRSQLRCR